jgi:RHS repeat-associated protein
MTVHARCVDKSAQQRCRATGATLVERRNNLRASCVCGLEQHYAYRYDELNRMSEARRFDREAGSWELKARQRYRYDANNQRTLKQTIDIATNDARVALYPLPEGFERRGLRLGNTSYDVVQGETETQYLVAGARVVWANKNALAQGIEPDHRITIAVPDLIQSTAAVIDLISGEPLEVTGFYPNGAREHYLTSSDPEALEIPLEPYGFTGKEAEEEVGLTYFGERFLVQRIGRWATPDPLSIHALGGGELGNSYHYISGNLLQARDPLGLEIFAQTSLGTNEKKQFGGVDTHFALTDGTEPKPRNGTERALPKEYADSGLKLYTCKGQCDFEPPGGSVRVDPAVVGARVTQDASNVGHSVLGNVLHAAVLWITNDPEKAAAWAALGAMGSTILEARIAGGSRKKVIEGENKKPLPAPNPGKRTNTVAGSGYPAAAPMPEADRKVQQRLSTMSNKQKRDTGSIAAPEGPGPARLSGAGEVYDVPLHPEFQRREGTIEGGTFTGRPCINCGAARVANDWLHFKGPDATSLEGLCIREVIPSNERPMTPCLNCQVILRGATLNGVKVK